MNRRARREAQLAQRRVLRRAERRYLETQALVFYPGFVHAVCGGAAERPSNWGAGAYCQKCGRLIPVEETRRVRTRVESGLD